MRTAFLLSAVSAVSALQPLVPEDIHIPRVADTGRLPTVTAHGMGDSCFNRGFKKVTEAISNATGSYAVCIPGGPNEPEDTLSGFFITMNRNVEIFAKKVRADPQLANGFNAAGFSQGNSVIRGYIHQYNDPPVRTFLSVHGTVMGVSGFPECNPADKFFGPVCDILDDVLGEGAYFEETQDLLFQANYYRDPMRFGDHQYRKNSQLAFWNGEGLTVNETYKANFVKVDRFAMIKAMKDTVVYPNEGEWWGSFAPHTYHTTLKMNETDMYQRDTFGLKTVNEAGKIVFNHTDHNHLDFTEAQLQWWVQNYFLA